MTIEQLEAQVLALPKDTLALLVARLIEHLGQVEKIDQQITNEWIQEAELRDEDMSNGKIAGISSQEVFSKLRIYLE
ncbi:MAG: addiction module protein [Sphaerospermopsis sp.]|jgi:Putative addiction module component|uniref:addiction module protein n=1 Tax=Sphaerospermopsis sp. LEGE 00249 TaxID=1380707 RepID=UPI00164D242B|nr:addiction module protein [Sphaerospermopsis sp. LEGE 00249]MBC5794979.1 addiction module protein [Sphaerospermopsis sp. LEGE 00249]MEB3149603.1 addiction module protein [Sphaerospermopsis sp.]